MTSDEQLDLWVKGESVHNPTTDECTPDFSCCELSLLAPIEERIAFRDADEEVRFSMLGMFLGRALASEGINAHIVDGTDPQEH